MSTKRKLIRQWVAQYGASFNTLRNMPDEDFAQMQRMEEHARSTIFSTARWEKENPDWRKRMPRNTMRVVQLVPMVVSSASIHVIPEERLRVRKMMELARKIKRAA